MTRKEETKIVKMVLSHLLDQEPWVFHDKNKNNVRTVLKYNAGCKEEIEHYLSNILEILRDTYKITGWSLYTSPYIGKYPRYHHDPQLVTGMVKYFSN